MYYIQWGSVGVYSDYGTSREKQLATLHAGDCFGEMSLLDSEPRTATIVALDRGTLLNRIDEEEFAEFLTTNSVKVHDILSHLCHKLRLATTNYLEACRALRRSVGDDTSDIDASSDYRFKDNAELVAIHDSVAQSLPPEA